MGKLIYNTGFGELSTFIQSPTLKTFAFDDFVIIGVEPTQNIDNGNVQIQLNDSGWVTIGQTNNQIETFVWLIPNLTPSENYNIFARIQKNNVFSGISLSNITMESSFTTAQNLLSDTLVFQKVFEDTRAFGGEPQLFYIINHEETMLALANNTFFTDETIASSTYMALIDDNDLALRILVLEQTNQDYTQFANFEAVASSQTAIDEILQSLPATKAVLASQSAMNVIAVSQMAMEKIAASQTAVEEVVQSSIALTKIVSTKIAMDEIADSSIAVIEFFSNSASRVAMWNSAVAEKALRDNASAMQVIDNNFAINKSNCPQPFVFALIQEGPLFTVTVTSNDESTSGSRSGRNFIHFQDGITEPTLTVSPSPGSGRWTIAEGRMMDTFEFKTSGSSQARCRSARIVIMD